MEESGNVTPAKINCYLKTTIFVVIIYLMMEMSNLIIKLKRERERMLTLN